MQSPRRWSVLSLLLLVGFSLGLEAAAAQATVAPTTQTDRVQATVDNSRRTRLAGHRPAWTATNADLGSVADATPIQIVVSLNRAPEVQAAFDQVTLDQQNPASPRYHRWLTPQQAGAQFGPTQHDLDAVTGWLAAEGFHIDRVEPSRVSVQATGTAGLVSAAFETSLHRYAGRNGDLRASATEPSVPLALAPVIVFVGGLTEVPRHTNFTQTGPLLNTETNIRAAGGSGATRPAMTLSGGTHFIAPADFAVLYDLNPVYNAGTRGTGQKIMIIGGSRLNPADLANWESLSGLGSAAPNYIVGTGFVDPGITNDGNQGEGTLDFERAYATAPGATVDMVIAQNWLSGTVSFNLISYAVNTVNDPVLSMSFSACEADEPTGFVAQENTLFQQAAAQGISIFASSGDAGVDGCEQQGVAAQATQIASISDICASSYVTCVGGTEFNDTPAASYWSGTNSNSFESALGYIPEAAWNEPNSTNSAGAAIVIVAASGGGASTVIPKPTWQVGTGVPADEARDVPDLSFSASIHNAYFSCLAYAGASCVVNAQGSFSLTGFGGTSASAPAMAAVAALLDQRLGAAQGNFNPLLYKLFGTTPAAFHDATIVSSGVSGCTAAMPSLCNNSDPAPTTLTGGLAGFLLQSGYDQVTGLGSLDVSRFLTAAAAAPALAPTSTSLKSPGSITTKQTVQLTAIVSSTSGGTPTGTIQFSSNGVALGAAVALSGGQASSPAQSFPAAGTYALAAGYSGDSNFAASGGAASLVVTAASVATATSLSGIPPTSTTLTTFTPVATVVPSGGSGTPTGTVQFSVDGTARGSAVTLVGGTASLASFNLSVGSHTVSAVYSGDTVFAGSSTTAATVTAAVSFTLSPATASLSLASAASASGSDVITATTGSGFAGTISFTCSVALTSGAIAAIPPGCSASPAGVQFPTVAGTTIQLTTIAPHDLPVKGAGLRLPGALVVGLMLGGVCWPLRRRRWSALGAGLGVVLMTALGGCGSGGTPAAVLSGGTTTGAYTVTVNGASTNAGTTTSASTNFSVTVN